MAALVVPGSVYVHQGGVYSLAPARTIAAVAALVVALRTKNVLATHAAGMVVLWVAQWALGMLG